jgi:hypothetical protein
MKRPIAIIVSSILTNYLRNNAQSVFPIHRCGRDNIKPIDRKTVQCPNLLHHVERQFHPQPFPGCIAYVTELVGV